VARCYARWTQYQGQEYRDQTIIKLNDYDDNWDLYASIILLNPGSALPQYDEQTFTSTLAKLNLPYFINQGQYFRFELDPLMRALVEYLADNGICTSVIKIYNLFNLRTEFAKSTEAIQCYEEIIKNLTPEINCLIHTNILEVEYGKNNELVIFAQGTSHTNIQLLEKQVNEYMGLAIKQNSTISALYKTPLNKKQFAFLPYQQNQQIYHPSYTFNYGNKTIFTDESCF